MPRRRHLLPLILVLVLLALLPGAELLLQLAYDALHHSFGLAVNLISVGLVLFLVSAFFAPLEALGWWAGWFGEELRPPVSVGALATPVREDQPIRRWVVYLDGIGQASIQALPEGEDFLLQLAERLPADFAIVRGIMPYSVVNQPLTESRWLGQFWRWVDRLRIRHPQALLGAVINLRNILVVAVSADQRYGPIYNQGMAQVITDSLLANGYVPASGTPVTLLGFSGGGQISVGALPHLRRVLQAPVEVISLGGVFAGSNQFLAAEHLFHLVGERDRVERIGPVAFPGRWRLQPLSYWNRARRRGKVSLISLGPVGHELPGGIFDAKALLADGRSHLQQTLDLVSAILTEVKPAELRGPREANNYLRYQANTWHRLAPLRDGGPLSSPAMRPLDDWIGRLILPLPEDRWGGVWFEVIHAPASWSQLRGRRLRLDWHDPLLAHLRMDVHFSDEALQSVADGGVHPLRLNHWRQVSPLESLAGARPQDDQLVRLPNPVRVLPPSPSPATAAGEGPRLLILDEPLQTTGTALALVRFETPGCSPEPSAAMGGELPATTRRPATAAAHPTSGADGGSALAAHLPPTPASGAERAAALQSDPPEWPWSGVSFDRATGRFDGPRLRLRLPAPVANSEGIVPTTSRGLANAPTNHGGWYVSGVPDGDGGFVVQSMLPRQLQRFAPERVICGRRRAWEYLKRQAWHQPRSGSASAVLVTGRPMGEQEALAEWQAGDRLLVLHVFGGIGGQQREAALAGGICTGHFAYGVATLESEPLSGELGLALTYRQVYAHNPDGIISGAQDRWRYLGDRQWGWLGTRPVADILVRFPPLTASYEVQGQERSLLRDLERQLAVMTARYRLGDGTGATFVGPANNCSQDSNQALFAAIQGLQQELRQLDGRALRAWQQQDPAQAQRLRQLLRLEKELRRTLLPFAGLRPDWQQQREDLGISLEDRPLDNLLRGLGSWRALLPRMACDTVMKVFLGHGASALVLRANQLGGEHPEIEPVAPLTLGW